MMRRVIVREIVQFLGGKRYEVVDPYSNKLLYKCKFLSSLEGKASRMKWRIVDTVKVIEGR